MADQNNNGNKQTQTQTTVVVTPEVEYIPDSADIEKNKVMAGLAYILFFLPLIVCPESKYAKFHANQGLLLLIVAIGGNILLGPVLGWLLLPLLLLPFFGIAVVIFAIIGLINGFTGKAKKLPLFGKFVIIKL